MKYRRRYFKYRAAFKKKKKKKGQKKEKRKKARRPFPSTLVLSSLTAPTCTRPADPEAAPVVTGMKAQQLHFTGTAKRQKLHRRQKRAGRQVVSWLCSLRTRGEAGFERSPSSRKLARHRFLSPNPPVQRRYHQTRHSEE